MQRFRQDNTEGYSGSELAIMNKAFGQIAGDEELDKSVLDHIAEEVQFRFDRGLRDGDLLAISNDALHRVYVEEAAITA